MYKNNDLPTNRQTQTSNVPTKGKKLKTIFRAVNVKHYTLISDFMSQDRRISFKARGVLLYLLSKPDDWQVKVSELNQASPQGKRAVQSGLKELRALGYAKLAWIKDGTNKMRSQYFISELPVPEWAENPKLVDTMLKDYALSIFQKTFTREMQAKDFLNHAKVLFKEKYQSKFGAKFTFDRRHTKAIKDLLFAIVDSVDEYFEGRATNEQILKGFGNLLSKALTKCKQPKQFTPSYILHILHTLRSPRTF